MEFLYKKSRDLNDKIVKSPMLKNEDIFTKIFSLLFSDINNKIVSIIES